MILRQGVNAAVHVAGGLVLGVTVVLAACTVAQSACRIAGQAKSGGCRARRAAAPDHGGAHDVPSGAGSEPVETPAAPPAAPPVS